MNQLDTPTIATEVQVMFFDTDCAGVVHNIAYLRFIEVARTLLAEQLGMGLVGMNERGVYPVVVRTEIDYKRPAKLGDLLVVHGRLESVERLRFSISFEIKRPSDDTLIVQSRQMLCVIEMPNAKPVALPQDWGTRFEHLKRKRGA
jgi:acyl-CoA thioester hydrolase